MIVREAYRSREARVCRRHYDVPPPGAPALGPVQDARDHGCEFCDGRAVVTRVLAEVALEVRPAPRPRDADGDVTRPPPDPDVVHAAGDDAGYPVRLEADRATGGVLVRLDGLTYLASVADLPPPAQAALRALVAQAGAELEARRGGAP